MYICIYNVFNLKYLSSPKKNSELWNLKILTYLKINSIINKGLTRFIYDKYKKKIEYFKNTFSI